MIINISTGKVRLLIFHEHTKPGQVLQYQNAFNKTRKIKAFTKAIFVDPENKSKILREAIAYCSEHDQFKKKVGVRRAVTALIATFPREDRKKIWARVWNLNQVQQPEKPKPLHALEAELDWIENYRKSLLADITRIALGAQTA